MENSIGLCAEGVRKFPTGGRILTQPKTGQNLLKRVGNYDINYIKRYKLSPKAESHKKEICTKVYFRMKSDPRKQQTKQNSPTLSYLHEIPWLVQGHFYLWIRTLVFPHVWLSRLHKKVTKSERKQTRKHEMSIKHDVSYCVRATVPCLWGD